MTVQSRFYSFDNRKYYNVVSKKCDSIDDGVYRVTRFIKNKHNVSRLLNIDYNIVRKK